MDEKKIVIYSEGCSCASMDNSYFVITLYERDLVLLKKLAEWTRQLQEKAKLDEDMHSVVNIEYACMGSLDIRVYDVPNVIRASDVDLYTDLSMYNLAEVEVVEEKDKHEIRIDLESINMDTDMFYIAAYTKYSGVRFECGALSLRRVLSAWECKYGK